MFLKGFIFGSLLFVFTANHSVAQDFASATPQNILRPVGLNTVTINLSGNIIPAEFVVPDYSWSVIPSAGVTIAHTDLSIAQATASFTSAASGLFTFTLTRGTKDTSVSVNVGNLAAASNNGLDVSIFNVLSGAMISGSGPGFMFDPLPDATTTAALGVAINGYYYFMPNVVNTGNVTLYAASSNGQTINAVASFDLNGTSNNNLGFVRLAIDPTGKGWMLAGDGSRVYLASFIGNGLANTTITLVDDDVSVAGSTASVFQNGDLCFLGSGALFALANNGGGVTQIFTGTPNGSSTTLTKKWDLVDAAGNNFSGNVNGVAFDFLGSLYISTGGATGGLFYIDQNTVNTATGTVQCSLAWSGTGLTDLASNLFPQQTALPVKLLRFWGRYHSGVAILNWETESEQHFNHFEIERSNNGNNYISVAMRTAAGNANIRQTYEYRDELSSINGKAFAYRLKMVDSDGKFKYSNMILVRKEKDATRELSIHPNPITQGRATVLVSIYKAGNIDITVVDITGKVVCQQTSNVFEGINSISLNGLNHLPGGSYILQVTNEGIFHSAKFTIRR